MPNLRALLSAHGLERIADVVEPAIKPSTRLTATEPSEAACTRLGGSPSLPTQFAWPEWERGPLAFLAQLDLASLPIISGYDIPRTGALFFFHQGGGDAPWGFDPKEKGYAQVIYSPQPLDSSPLRTIPDDIEEERRHRGLAMDVGPLEQSIPDSRDQLIEELGLTPEESGRYEEVWDQWNYKVPDLKHRIAGYPDQLQGDLRLQAHLVSHGLYCGDSTGYNEGKNQRPLARCQGLGAVAPDRFRRRRRYDVGRYRPHLLPDPSRRPPRLPLRPHLGRPRVHVGGWALPVV
jgi:uncharacterized protein YwqG